MEQRARHAIASLALDELSVSRLASLPAAHRDPFDCMLACQAMTHGLAVATVDPAFSQFEVDLLPH